MMILGLTFAAAIPALAQETSISGSGGVIGTSGSETTGSAGGTGEGGFSATGGSSGNPATLGGSGVEMMPNRDNHFNPPTRPNAQEAAMLLHRLEEILGTAGTNETGPGRPGAPTSGGTDVRWTFSDGGGEIQALRQALQAKMVKSGPETFLGVAVTPAPPELFQQMSNQPEPPVHCGLVVQHIAKDSPAAKAGLQEGDVLAKLDDQILMLPEQLAMLVAGKKEGENVKLTYLRKGQAQEAVVTLTSHSPAVEMGRVRIGDADLVIDGTAGGRPLRTFTRTFSGPSPEKADYPEERKSDTAEIRDRLQKIEATLEELKKSIKP